MLDSQANDEAAKYTCCEENVVIVNLTSLSEVYVMHDNSN